MKNKELQEKLQQFPSDANISLTWKYDRPHTVTKIEYSEALNTIILDNPHLCETLKHKFADKLVGCIKEFVQENPEAKKNFEAVEEALVEKQNRVWETFCDQSYYGMWCIRPVGDRDFNSPYNFHVSEKEEAEHLMNFLNSL